MLENIIVKTIYNNISIHLENTSLLFSTAAFVKPWTHGGHTSQTLRFYCSLCKTLNSWGHTSQTLRFYCSLCKTLNSWGSHLTDLDVLLQPLCNFEPIGFTPHRPWGFTAASVKLGTHEGHTSQILRFYCSLCKTLNPWGSHLTDLEALLQSL